MTDKEKFLTEHYLTLKRITQSLEVMQKELAEHGYDYIAYGCITQALLSCYTARCNVNNILLCGKMQRQQGKRGIE